MPLLFNKTLTKSRKCYETTHYFNRNHTFAKNVKCELHKEALYMILKG